MATRNTAKSQPLDEFTEQDAANELAQVNNSPATDDKTQDEVFADRMRAVLHGGGDGIKVKLYRFTPTGERAFLRNYSPEQFDAGDYEMIREQWGAGRFEVRVIGKTGLLTKGEFLIEEMRDTNPAQSSASSHEVTAILRAMQEQTAAVLATLQQRPDPAAQMREMLQSMALVREAMGMNAPQVAPAPAVSPTAMLSELLGAMKALKEVAAETAPPAPSEDPMSMLATLGPQVLDLVKTGMSQRGAAQAHTPALPAPVNLPASMNSAPSSTPAAPQPAPQETGENVNALQIMMLRGLLQQLVKIKIDGGTPQAGGEFIYDKAPDALIEALELPNWWEILSTFEPAVIPHQEWITQAHAWVLAELAKPDETP
jgi:hypothetical protein